MPFDAQTLALVENALSECFNYHNQLDTFLARAGVPQTVVDQARGHAERRAREARREYSRAPKRFVAQEILKLLSERGTEGDRELAATITSLVRGAFPDATATATAAIDALRLKVGSDREERERQRKEREADEQEKLRKAERTREVTRSKIQKERDDLYERFLGLMAEGNTQARGYLFEAFLNDLFAFEKLAPRGSFKIVGEQIDGSFVWRNRTYLVEAKWVKDAIAGAEFGAFAYKIEGKTADTRGLYVSVNGYSPQAIVGLNGKGALKFVCADGAHLVRALSAGQTLAQVLERVWRHADETGEAYLDVGRFNS